MIGTSGRYRVRHVCIERRTVHWLASSWLRGSGSSLGVAGVLGKRLHTVDMPVDENNGTFWRVRTMWDFGATKVRRDSLEDVDLVIEVAL